MGNIQDCTCTVTPGSAVKAMVASCCGQCLTVMLLLEAVLGFLLPTIGIYWLELRSR
jgi:hypothetical protein